MTLRTITIAEQPGGTWYAFPGEDPETYPLSAWTTHRVELTDDESVGLYQGQGDDSKGAVWYVFEGSAQPASFGDAVYIFPMSEALTADEVTSLKAILGIPASGTTPETPTSGVLAAIKTKTDLITPGQVYAITRITRTGSIVDVEQFEHETTLPEPFDTTIDYSATALECVWERESDNTEIAKIDNAAFTKTASTLAINEIPVAVRSTVRTLKYSIRVVTGERVIQTGNWIVSRAPRDRS